MATRCLNYFYALWTPCCRAHPGLKLIHRYHDQKVAEITARSRLIKEKEKRSNKKERQADLIGATNRCQSSQYCQKERYTFELEK